VLFARLLARGQRDRGHHVVGGDCAAHPLSAVRGGRPRGDCGVADVYCWRLCAAAQPRRHAASPAGAAEHSGGDARVFDGTLAPDTLPTHPGQRRKLAEVPALWVAALELISRGNFQLLYRTLRDGAGLTSLMRNQACCKEGNAAVAEAVVAPKDEAADGTASGIAETVPPGKKAPA